MEVCDGLMTLALSREELIKTCSSILQKEIILFVFRIVIVMQNKCKMKILLRSCALNEHMEACWGSGGIAPRII
jgi:hypothetical protein